MLLIFTLHQRDRLLTRKILESFNANGERPWAELKQSKMVTDSYRTRQLRPYDVGPRTIRVGDQVAKGCMEANFKQSFKRYIPWAQHGTLKTDLVAARETPEEGAGGGANTQNAGGR